MPALLTDSQRRALGSLVLFRLLTITILLVSTTAVNVKSGQTWTKGQLIVSLFIGVLYLLSILYLLAIKVNANYRFQGYTQIFVDLLFWSCLIYLTDGLHSPFTFLYVLTILYAAYLLGRAGAFVAFVLAAGLFVTLVWMEAHTVLHGTLGLTPSFKELYDIANLYPLLMNGSMLLLVAVFASYLATQLKERDEELQRERLSLEMQRLLNRSIVTGLNAGFVVLDPDGCITFLNLAAERLLGRSFELARGRALSDLVPELAAALARECANQVWARHEDIKRQDGESARYFSASFSNLLGLDNHRVGTILILDDITERRQWEERAFRNEKLAAVGALAAGIAHEIRNPLASISGSIQMMQRELPGDDDSSKLMEISLREIDRLNQLITDFLAYARPRPLHLSLLNLREILEDITALLAGQPENAHVRMRVEIDAGLPEVQADAAQVRQVLWNIIKNAVEASRARQTGVVWIKAEREKREGDDGLLVTIQDNGPGMDEATAARIFDPFFTTKHGGTGLGLSIAHQAVRAHGGSLEAESKADEGACFRVRLPAVAAAPLRSSEAS